MRACETCSSFLLARDTYHQRQWMAAIEELESEGLETTPVPGVFPRELERVENNHQFWNFSSGNGEQGRPLDEDQGGWERH